MQQQRRPMSSMAPDARTAQAGVLFVRVAGAVIVGAAGAALVLTASIAAPHEAPDSRRHRCDRGVRPGRTLGPRRGTRRDRRVRSRLGVGVRICHRPDVCLPGAHRPRSLGRDHRSRCDPRHLPSLWPPIALLRPSAWVAWFLYVLGYVPSVVIPVFSLVRPRRRPSRPQ